MKCKLIYLFLINYFFVAVSFAQSTDINLNQIVPPSPTAAAIAKFGEIPVSPYTGVANISIPLYEVKNKALTVPIALAYHSGGIKVEEEASWVGLGWSLTSGGSITRMVRALDDLPTITGERGYPDAYLPTSFNPSTGQYETPSNAAQKQYDLDWLQQVLHGSEDTEPDIFVFNFNGRSGKFVLKKRASPTMPLEVMLLSQEDLRIKVTFNSQSHNYEWVITDEKGIKYYFNTIESTLSRSGAADEEFMADQNAPEGEPTDAVTSWYLDKITSPTGAEITFNYYSSNSIGYGTKKILSRSQAKKYIYELEDPTGQCMPNDMATFMYFSSYTEVRDVYLTEIIFPEGKVEFKLSDRQDIEPIQGGLPLTYAKKVDEVAISRRTEAGAYSLEKKFVFNYSYFGTFDDYLNRRLKLASVTESDGTVNNPPYVFTYDPQQLPEKDSKSIDHWGYYNGANNSNVNETTYGDMIVNGTTIPPARLHITATGENRQLAGANRKPNFNFARACTLSSITYPTGGSTTFEYELNEYYAPNTIEHVTGYQEYAVKWGQYTGVPNYFPQTITIELDQLTTVNVATSVQCYGGNTCLYVGGEYEYDVAHIQAIDGTPYYNQWIGYLLTYDNQGNGDYQEMDIELPPGRYTFTVFADENYVSNMLVSWNEKTYETIYNSPAAGLRIRTVTTYDGISHLNDQLTSYKYAKKVGEIEFSTGKLMSDPEYEYDEATLMSCELTPAWNTNCRSLVRSSSPIIPISSAAQGNVIGYDQVTVTKTGNGKTVYDYCNEEDLVSYPVLPNVPTQPFSGNGLIAKETICRNNADGTFTEVKTVSKDYIFAARSEVVLALKIPSFDLFTFMSNSRTIPSFANVKFYPVASHWDHPDTETTTTKSQSDENLAVQQTTNYYYENAQWHQLTGQSVTDSKNNVRTETYKYPFDYAGNTVYDEMVLRNQVGNVVEQIRAVNGNHLESTKTNYNFWYNNTWGNNSAGNIIVPQTVDTKNLGQLSYETRIRYHSYNDKGDPTSVSKENDIAKTYIWGYNNTYPVAEVIGASYSEVMTILTQTVLQNPSSDEALRDELQKIRDQFPNAMVTTYTYKPVLGMTSQTDAGNHTTYFEYDSFGRLKLIRDQDNNVVKAFDYKYQVQP